MEMQRQARLEVEDCAKPLAAFTASKRAERDLSTSVKKD